MMTTVLFLAFVLGAIIGSFLNVFILRYHTGRSVRGRSACLSCAAKLSWYELIPIVSFAAQGGRCRSCQAALSWQYPAIELVTGLVFAAVIYRDLLTYLPAEASAQAGNLQPTFHSLFSTLYFLLSFSLLITITAYDLRHKIIPNGWVWTFIGLSFLYALMPGSPTNQLINLSINLIVGPLLALPFVLIWLLSKGKAMGLGDAKLALGIGWMLGLVEGLSALLLSFWIGGLVGIFLLLRPGKRFTMKSEIPFAPFLALGAFLAFFLQLDITGIASWTQF